MIGWMDGCAHVCMSPCVSACKCARMYVCMHVRMCARLIYFYSYLSTYLLTYLSTYLTWLPTYPSIYLPIYLYVCFYMYVYTHAWTCVTFFMPYLILVPTSNRHLLLRQVHLCGKTLFTWPRIHPCPCHPNYCKFLSPCTCAFIEAAGKFIPSLTL